MRREVRADAGREVVLERLRLRDPELRHARARRRRSGPLRRLDLVAADVDVAAREHVHHLAQHVLEEAEGLVIDAVDVVVDPPVRGHGLRRIGARGEFRIGRERGRRMSRQLDLRHDGDAALRGVGHELARLDLRVVAAVAARRAGAGIDVGRGGGAGRHAPRADLGQARIFRDLEAPALVVRQVPVQHVELVQRHPVQVAPDELRRLQVARAVEHESAPWEARGVLDVDGGQRERALPHRRRQLPERDGAVQQAGCVARGDRGVAGVGVDAIRLGRRLRTRERDGAVPRFAFDNGRVQSARALQQGRQALGGAAGLGVTRRDHDRSVVAPCERAARASHDGGIGDHGSAREPGARGRGAGAGAGPRVRRPAFGDSSHQQQERRG